MDIKLGTDPELFVFDTRRDRFVSAHDMIPGTKAEPFKVECGAIQPDGLAAEFNIDAADTLEEWERNITTVLQILTDRIREVDRNYVLKFVPYAEFDLAYFKSLPDEAKVLGCDPDYRYDGTLNINPSERIGGQPLRTASGHVHIGWTNGQKLVGAHFEDCKFISRNFLYHDMFTPKTGLCHKRLQYYGMLGSFRPKPYGIELRAAGNWWVEKQETRRRMYDTIHTHMDNLYRQTEAIRKAA